MYWITSFPKPQTRPSNRLLITCSQMLMKQYKAKISIIKVSIQLTELLIVQFPPPIEVNYSFIIISGSKCLCYPWLLTSLTGLWLTSLNHFCYCRSDLSYHRLLHGVVKNSVRLSSYVSFQSHRGYFSCSPSDPIENAAQIFTPSQRIMMLSTLLQKGS